MPSIRPSDGAIRRLVRAIGDRRAAPDVRWVEALSGAPTRAVRSAILELDRHLPLEATIHDVHLSGGRTFYAQICAPVELYALVRLSRPAHVVETGVSSGVSSAHFLLGLRENGRGTLHSIDLPTRASASGSRHRDSVVSLPPGRSSGWVVPKALRRGWDLRLGPSQRLLPHLIDELPSVDLFLHDDLHTPTHLRFELERLRSKLRPGSIVLADNTNWTGQAFDRFARSMGAKVRRRRGSHLVGLRVPETGPLRP